MRLLGLNNSYAPAARGGYGEICADVMGGLAARGHDVTVLTSEVAGLPSEEELGGVKVRRGLRPVLAAWRRPHRARAAARNDAALIRGALAPEVEAVLVWHMRGVVKPPLRLLHEAGIPVIYLLHDRWVLYERPGSVFVPWARVEGLATRVLREPPIARAGLVCFNSGWLRDEHARLGWTPRRQTLVPCGLTPDFLGAVPERAAVPSRLMFAGRIDPTKGPQDAIAALARLPDEVTLSIAGPETVPGYLESLRAEGGPRVRWLGDLARPALLDAFASHDVLVYPSRVPESFGLGILEALGAGLVAVTSATGGPREFLVDGENCLLHDPRDVPALAGAIDRLRSEDGLAKRLREAGRRTAESMQVGAVVGRVERIIAEATG